MKEKVFKIGFKRRLLSLVLLATLVLSITACGGGSDEKTDSQSTSQKEETVTENNSSSAETEEEKFASVEELLSHPEAAAELEDAMSGLTDDEMSVEIYGNGAELVYGLKLLDMGGADSETMADALREAFSSMNDYFVELAGSLREVVDVPTPVVVIEVLDPDDQVIMREEYPAK